MYYYLTTKHKLAKVKKNKQHCSPNGT